MRYGVLAGLTAGLVMTLPMIVLRVLLNTVSIPEVLAEWLVEITPGSFFSEILGLLESFAKLVLITGLLIAQVLIGGAFGVVYTRILNPVHLDVLPPWMGGVTFALFLWLITMTLVVPVAGGGVFGGSLAGNQVRFLVASLIPYLLYGWFLSTAYDDLYNRTTSERAFAGRRRFLKWSAIGLFGVFLGAIGIKLVSQVGSITSARGIDSGEMPLPVTPNQDFYIVSKNFVDPEVSAENWILEVGGMVEEPYSLSYEELTSLPWVDEYITLECISNKVGGNLISNAKWRGVLLKDLLDRARLKAGVVDIASFSRDGYSESMPLEKALEPQVLVAYMMNDEPLPAKHGFPARLIVPGLYGEKCSKWLNRLDAVDYDFLGYWQKRRWGDEGTIKTTSQIRVPENGDRLAQMEVLVGGLAFAGDQGISQVELSPDDGDTWMATTLTDPLSQYTWVLWTTKWVPPDTGRLKLLVRTTDGQGLQQITEAHGTFPNGATGLHGITVTVTNEQAS